MNRFQKMKSYIARASVAALLIALLWGCGRVPPVTEMAPPSSRLPFVGVLLDNTATAHDVSSVGDDELSIDCFKDGKHLVYFSRKEIKIKGKGKKLALSNSDGYALDDGIDRILVSPRGKERVLAYDGKKYRGLLEMTASSGQITLVNLVYVEDYLKGVVALEIGPCQEDQIEAVKAQAIAARTYAMAHLGQFGPEAGYDLKSDVSDQVYGGVAAESDLTSRAVEATTGQVAVYHDKMINAYYHSTCGGTTDDIEDVWDKDPQPYLVSVSDDGACSISKYYSWREKFTADQIVLRLNQYLTQERGEQVNVGKLTDIRVGARTPGGRVASVIFETTSGHYIFKKEKVRWVIKQSEAPDAILRSAKFSFEIKKNGAGDISEVTFVGNGWGHGVGMCQMGAKGLSARGVTCDSIITLYYQGTQLKKLY
jgi:stage II sporulation protein D